MIVLLVGQMGAQQQQQTQHEAVTRARSGDAKPGKNAPKTSKEETQLASQLLEVSETEARGFEVSMRSFSLLQISQVYVALDPARARAMLKDALIASLGIEDDNIKLNLQNDIFRSLLPLSQPDVEELLPRALPAARKRASDAIISRYVEKKQYGAATELITQLSRLDEFPYGSGSTLLRAMPAEMNGEKMSLFSQAVNSFKTHEHKTIRTGSDTFTSMVARFGDQMPPQLTLQAIDEILSQAKKNTEPFNLTMSGTGGGASFSSLYEYQLFALLPLLRQLDESRVKSLLEEDRALQANDRQLPNGLQSIDPSFQKGDADHPPAMAMNNDMIDAAKAWAAASAQEGSGIGSGNGSGMNNPVGFNNNAVFDATNQAKQLVQNSSENAMQAIARAATLPIKMGQPPSSPRAMALEGIAQANAKENPKAAKQALDEMRKSLTDLPLNLQIKYLVEAAGIYQEMGERDSVEKVVSEGFKVADKMLERDTDHDDPNRALKAYWPSVDAYRRFIEIQTKISQRSALKILTEIKDPEIRALESIIVARAMMGIPVKNFTVMEKSKNSTWVTMHSEE
jgi:hypothetical protein